MRRDGTGLKRVLGGGFDQRKRGQDAFHRHKAITGLFGQLFCLGQNLAGLLIHIGLSGIARHLWDFPNRKIKRLNHALGRATGPADQVAGKPLGVVHQGLEDMFGG